MPLAGHEIAQVVSAVELAEKRLWLRVKNEVEKLQKESADDMNWRYEPEAFSVLLVFQEYLFQEFVRAGMMSQQDAERVTALILADKCT